MVSDGITDRVDVPSKNYGTTYTLSCWVKTTDVSGVAISGDSNTSYALHITGTKIYHYPFGGGYYNQSATVADGVWHHIAIARSGGDIEFYVDGSNIGTTSGAVGDMIVAAFFAYENGSYTMVGNMDEIAFFSTQLSSAQITTIYNSGEPTDLSTFSLKSFAFDGVDDYISMGDVLHTDGDTPMTVSAWVNISATAPHTYIYPIAGKKKVRMAPTYIMSGWEVGFITSGIAHNQLIFNLVGDGSSATGTLSKKALTLAFEDGKWHNVVITYDGSGDASGVKFYVDGTEDTWTQTLGDTFSGTLANDATVDFQIGKSPKYGGTNYYEGNIDDLAIFNSVKAIGDIWTGTGKPTDLSAETGLIAYWKFDDALYNGATTEFSVPDSSENSNTGDTVNMDFADLETSAPLSPVIM